MKNEIIWTQLWFAHQKQLWERRMKTASLALSGGHEVYAAKQMGMWADYSEKARKEFGGMMTDM